MGLVDLIRDRFASSGASDVIADPRFFSEFGFGRKTSSGETVSPVRALTLGAYFAAIRVISEDVAKLPIHLYRDEKRGKSLVTGDPVTQVLENPNPEMTGYTFRETTTQWALGWGNGWAEIVRDNAGRIRELWPIHPSRIRPFRRPNGVLIFQVFADYDPTNRMPPDIKTYVELEADQVFHLRGMGNATLGYSIVAFAAEALGVALAAQTFGAAFFANGTQGGGVLTHPGKLSDVARTNLRESWNKAYGTAKNGYSMKVLEEGVTFTNTFVPPNDAQFIETREFQVEEIARWFRIAPHKIGHLKRSTFNNIEQQSIEHVTDTLMPWLVRWEKEIKRQLMPAASDTVHAKHNVAEVMRGDANARANFYRTMVNIGAYSPNDVREMEDENPILAPAGDEYFMQTNMTTLDRIASGQVVAAGQPGTTGDAKEISERHRQVLAQAAVFRPVLEAAADRVLRKEAMAVQRAAGKAGFAEWATGFYAEQRDYLTEAMGAAVVALHEMSASVLGVEPSFGMDTWNAWAGAWTAAAAAAVTSAGSHEGIPASHTPAALAAEVSDLVLRHYGVTP